MRNDEKIAPRGRGAERLKTSDAVEVIVSGYSKIVVFRDEQAFLDALEMNPQLKALYGTKAYEKQL